MQHLLKISIYTPTCRQSTSSSWLLVEGVWKNLANQLYVEEFWVFFFCPVAANVVRNHLHLNNTTYCTVCGHMQANVCIYVFYVQFSNWISLFKPCILGTPGFICGYAQMDCTQFQEKSTCDCVCVSLHSDVTVRTY